MRCIVLSSTEYSGLVDFLKLYTRGRPQLIKNVPAIIVFVFISTIYFVWTWSTILAGAGGDNAIYALMAQDYSPFTKPSVVAEHFTSASQYPPLYPFVLAITYAAESLLIAHLVTTTFLLLAFMVLFYWCRLEGWGITKAMSLTLIVALLPGTYLQALYLHSENLYLFLSMISFCFVSLYSNDKDQKWIWYAAVAVSLASLTRSVGITLVGAFVLFVWLHKCNHKQYLSLLAMAPWITWRIFGYHTGTSYIESLVSKYTNDLSLTSHLGHELLALWSAWLSNISVAHINFVILSILAVVSLAGAVRRLLLKKFDGIYISFYLVIILVWPFPAEAQRFLIIITPILFFQALCLLTEIPVLIVRQNKLLPLVFLLCIGFTVAPDVFFTFQRYRTPMPAELTEYKRHYLWYVKDQDSALRQIQSLNAIDKNLSQLQSIVPDGECIFSIKPSYISFYSNRMSVGVPLKKLPQDEFMYQIERLGCKYFYMIPFSSPSFSEPFYPLERMRDYFQHIGYVHLDGTKSGATAAIIGVYQN